MTAVLLLCLSAICFGYAAVALCGRGPLLTARLPLENARGTASVRAEYRVIARMFLGFGLCFLSFAGMFAWGGLWLASLSVALSALVAGSACIFCVRAFWPSKGGE